MKKIGISFKAVFARTSVNSVPIMITSPRIRWSSSFIRTNVASGAIMLQESSIPTPQESVS
jgi:hypothetical protein